MRTQSEPENLEADFRAAAATFRQRGGAVAKRSISLSRFFDRMAKSSDSLGSIAARVEKLEAECCLRRFLGVGGRRH
jgi:hypothetical protein